MKILCQVCPVLELRIKIAVFGWSETRAIESVEVSAVSESKEESGLPQTQDFLYIFFGFRIAVWFSWATSFAINSGKSICCRDEWERGEPRWIQRSIRFELGVRQPKFDLIFWFLPLNCLVSISDSTSSWGNEWGRSSRRFGDPLVSCSWDTLLVVADCSAPLEDHSQSKTQEDEPGVSNIWSQQQTPIVFGCSDSQSESENEEGQGLISLTWSSPHPPPL